MHASLASGLSAAVLVLAAGCTSSDDTPGAAETPDSPAAQASTGTPSPSPSPTSSTSEPDTDNLPLLDRLLPTGRSRA